MRNIALSVAVVALAATAHADDFSWNQPAGGLFGDEANWNDGASGVPAIGDVAIFDVLGFFTVEFGDSQTNDRMLARSGNVTFDLPGSGVVYEMTGGTAEMPGIVIAELARDTAEVELFKGILRSAHATIGLVPTSAGSLVLSGIDTGDGVLEANVFVLGDGGTGLLRMQDSATATIGRAELGLTSTGLGDIRVNDTATFNVENDFVIGGAGVGNVLVQSDMPLTAGSIVLGRDPGAAGRLTIEFDNAVAVAGDVEAGRDGVAVIEVADATDVALTVGGSLTAREVEPGTTPVVIVIANFPTAGAPIQVTGNAAIDRVEIVIEGTYVPAVDAEISLITAAGGLAGTPVTGELPVAGLAWETAGTDVQLTGRIIIDPLCESEPGKDCNNNGVRDDCDISFGESADCNANGRPDECDLADAISFDCNMNGAPDECDIADGTSDDCNSDTVPDDCTPADPRSVLDAFGGAGDAFGATVDVDGMYAVVGSPDASPPYVTVFVQRGTRWVREAKLVPDDGTPGDGFGQAVGIGGTTVVVGAPGAPDGGAAYVFQLSEVLGEWAQTAKLENPDTVGNVDGFAHSVDTNGAFVVVGARETLSGLSRGVGYIFSLAKAWALDTTFTTPSLEVSLLPGASVAMGDRVAAALWPGDSADDRGRIALVEYIVSIDNWFNRTVFPPDGVLVGPALAVENDAIAARIESETFRGVGIAERVGSSFFQFDTLLDQPGGDSFGSALGIDAGRLAVGASGDGAAGRIYTYRQIDVLIWPPGGTLDAPGSAVIGDTVGLGGARLIAGVPTDDTQGADAGAAWIVDLPGPDCNANGVWDLCDIIDGTSADQDGDGVPDECADTCPYDLDESGVVGFNDLSIVLASWGTCPNCLADVSESGSVGFLELSDLLQAWGECP